MSDGGGLIDVSRPLDPEELPRWPGSPELELERWLDLEEGDEATDTRVSMSLHAGTHLDAPSHRLRDGATADEIELDALNGPCRVADLRGRGRVTREALEAAGVPEGCDRLLLRTDNSDRPSSSFDPAFVALSADAAALLAERALRVLGIDYLSVESPGGDGRVHELLLEGGTALLEGLDLSGVGEGAYRLHCLPMSFVGTEAAPARACLAPAPDPDEEARVTRTGGRS